MNAQKANDFIKQIKNINSVVENKCAHWLIDESQKILICEKTDITNLEDSLNVVTLTDYEYIGNNVLRLEIQDKSGNTKEYSATPIYPNNASQFDILQIKPRTL